MPDEIQPDPAPRRRRSEEFQDDEPRARRRRRPDPEDEDDFDRRIRRQDTGVEAFIPYRNPQGLLAYYCGVFALIPCAGLLLGPAALILGILGLRYGKRHPTARGAGHAIAGIVLGALAALGNWGVVLAIVVAALKGP
jgi:hypothetical protein